MADLTFTVTMDATAAASVMKNLKGQASDTAQAVQKSFNLSLLLIATKKGFQFMGSSMQEYAKESAEAKRSVDSITEAWSALKGEVGYGLSSLLGGGAMPSAKDIREAFGGARAEAMAGAIDPLGYMGAAGARYLATVADWMPGGGRMSNQLDQWAGRQFDNNDAYKGGIQEMERREKAIVDMLQEGLKTRAMDLRDQVDGVGASDLDRTKIAIESEFRHEIEQVVALKKENAALDTAELVSLAEKRREVKLLEAQWQDAVRRRAERFDQETTQADAVRRMNQGRADFREGMKRSQEDRALSIEALKKGDTLELAQRRARLEAERDIEAIRKEQAFNDPSVQEPYIRKRREQLDEELAALQAAYRKREDRGFTTASGSLGAVTLYQQLGAPGRNEGEAQTAAKKSLDALQKIEKNTRPDAQRSAVAVLG